jgi:hypothetical protein
VKVIFFLSLSFLFTSYLFTVLSLHSSPPPISVPSLPTSRNSWHLAVSEFEYNRKDCRQSEKHQILMCRTQTATGFAVGNEGEGEQVLIKPEPVVFGMCECPLPSFFCFSFTVADQSSGGQIGTVVDIDLEITGGQ